MRRGGPWCSSFITETLAVQYSIGTAFDGQDGLEKALARWSWVDGDKRAWLSHNGIKTMTLANGLEISTEKLAGICRRYRVREMAVFGSAARGELRPDSDIDVLVEFLPQAEIGWEFFRLEEELSELFGRRVDLGTKRSLKPWVRANALRDARVIYAA